MRALALQEYCSISGAGTQVFDDGSTLTTDDAGNVTGFTDTDGSSFSYGYSGQNYVLNGGAGIAGAYLLGGPPGVALAGAAMAAQGVGQYNSAAGPGPGGTQNLPPSSFP